MGLSSERLFKPVQKIAKRQHVCRAAGRQPRRNELAMKRTGLLSSRGGQGTSGIKNNTRTPFCKCQGLLTPSMQKVGVVQNCNTRQKRLDAGPVGVQSGIKSFTHCQHRMTQRGKSLRRMLARTLHAITSTRGRSIGAITLMLRRKHVGAPKSPDLAAYPVGRTGMTANHIVPRTGCEKPERKNRATVGVDAPGCFQHFPLGTKTDLIQGSEVGSVAPCICHVLKITVKACDADDERRSVHISVTSGVAETNEPRFRITNEFRRQRGCRKIIDLFWGLRNMSTKGNRHSTRSRKLFSHSPRRQAFGPSSVLTKTSREELQSSRQETASPLCKTISPSIRGPGLRSLPIRRSRTACNSFIPTTLTRRSISDVG